MPGACTDSVTGYLADSAESQPSLSVGVGASAMGHVMASRNPLVFDGLSDNSRRASHSAETWLQSQGFDSPAG